jgi:hypothetical protein
LLLALQDFSVKWIRAMPEHYHCWEPYENGVISSIRIHQGERDAAKADFP